MSELEVRGLHKAYGGRTALAGVDLHVGTGQLAAVLGPSGCGKTTLLRLVAGFVRPDAGTITLAGRQVAGPGRCLPPEQRRVGVVPQEGALFPHLSVAANVGFGLPRAARRSSRVEELLELVGLPGHGGRMPAELSGGEQQRVALARALAPEPPVVLLDEPFAALDAGLRASLREDVRRALRATGATAVLVTHDQAEALSVADVVAVVRAGRVVQTAAPAELYRTPVDQAVASFVGDAVVLAGVVDGGVARTPLGAVAVGHDVGAGADAAAPGPGVVVLRPEQLQVCGPSSGVPARVQGSTFFGHDSLLDLTVAGEDGRPVAVRARVLGPGRVAAGELVGLAVVGPGVFYPDGATRSA